ncbi:MAG: TlpA disulfide reductase family protein [Rhodothermales bacterium]
MNLIRPLAFCIIFLSIFVGCQSADKSVDGNPSPKPAQAVIPEPQSRDTMPAFILPTLAGNTFDSSAQEGRVLLVNFWATWCAPCRVEIPDLIALQEELGGEKFDVIGISLDTDDPAFVKEYTDAMEINYPLIIDDGEVAEAFGGVYALPTTYVVGKDGKITHRTIGLFPVESVKEELIEMINAE